MKSEDKRRKDSQIDRASPKDKYLRQRKQINLVGSLYGAQPPFEQCPKCPYGRLSTRQQNKVDGEWYLVCNNSPLCSHSQKYIEPKQLQGRTSLTKVQQKYSKEAEGKLFCHSFGSRGKNRPGKKLLDSDDWADNLFGGKARVVEGSEHTYNFSDGSFTEV